MGFDSAAFRLVNQGCANAVCDFVLPVLTLDLVNMAILIYCLFLALVRAAQAGTVRAARRAQRVVLLAALGVGLGELIAAHGLKPWLQRPRPPRVLDDVRLLVGVGHSGSFPSSHAVNTAAVMGVLALAYPRYRVPCVAYALLIGLSRVYVGVHWPSDVLGGLLLGFGLAGLLWRLAGVKESQSE